jgi:hypothetical protein
MNAIQIQSADWLGIQPVSPAAAGIQQRVREKSLASVREKSTDAHFQLYFPAIVSLRLKNV